MKTKKVLNIKPQEVCEGDEHYVRYKGSSCMRPSQPL